VILNIQLSTESINEAIAVLTQRKEIFDEHIETVVDILAEEGAMVANGAYGSMAKARAESAGNSGRIIASGKAVGVAEFGAGYAVMDYHPFANKAPFPVEIGSYSRSQYPYGLFYITNDLLGHGEGYWFFGHQMYQRVQPKHGLLDAYDYLMENSTEIARGVLAL